MLGCLVERGHRNMATVSEPRHDARGQPPGAEPAFHETGHPGAAARPAAIGGAPLSINGTSKHAAASSAGSDSEILLPPGSWYLLAKGGLDRVFAFLMLLATSPLILAAMALVKLTSRGPALYSQTRVGRHGKLFTIYKIRSMIVESESLTGACWSMPGDKRVTRVGNWLRKTHIDELPQLW